ncbi:MAG: Uma2 family endonuclease, partial [Cyanobacteriota bacterium]
ALPRFTSSDLALMPEDGKRYEVIDGDLHVTHQPNWHHQFAASRLYRFLDEWSEATGLGLANTAPGVIFAEDEDVAPDVVWISQTRLRTALGADGKLHSAPELAIEVLSPGSRNVSRDKQTKLKLYSRRGVQEYWVVDWQQQQVEVYQRQQEQLALLKTCLGEDKLSSPLLPGFECPISRLWMPPLL